jgi:hypothetical protein
LKTTFIQLLEKNMKKQFSIFAGLGFTTLAIFSCKEQPVGIDYGNSLQADTSYIAAVETPQTKNYYIEEFSGVKCVNCPQGAAKLEAMSNASENIDRLKIVTVHALSFATPDFNKGSKQDLRSIDGENIIKVIYGGEVGKPVASFDRLSVGNVGTGNLVGAPNAWDNMLSKAKQNQPNTPVNIHLTTKEVGANTYNINIKVAYTEDVSVPQYLTVYLVEDSIIDKQIEPEIENFVYRHVLRQSITPFNGRPILDSLNTKQAGVVYEANYQFVHEPNAENAYRHKDWKMKDIHVVAFVHNATAGADKRIYQVVDAHLK